MYLCLYVFCKESYLQLNFFQSAMHIFSEDEMYLHKNSQAY